MMIIRNSNCDIIGGFDYLPWIKLKPKVSFGLNGFLFLFLKILLLLTYAPTAFSTASNKFSIDFILAI